MAEAMIEDVAWESDEAEDWESDEALAEAEDSAEDIGERARRRRRRRRYYRPGRGVQGIAVRGQDGRVRNVPFPTKLATAAETNRGLANQEVARRALEERLDRLEARFRVQQKNDSSASGLVTLAIGGGLTAYGVIQAAKKTTGSRLGNWVAEDSTWMATLVSVTQIATSGAKLVINGQYHRSGIGIAADILAAAQIATYAFGSLYKPQEPPVTVSTVVGPTFTIGRYNPGTLILALDTNRMFEVITDSTGSPQLVVARN
jgi:hypothetical protein